MTITKNFCDDLKAEAYARSMCMNNKYTNKKQLYKMMKKASNKYKTNIKVNPKKIRKYDLYELKKEGFALSYSKSFCGLFKRKIIISWIDESMDIVEQVMKGNIGGTIFETIDMGIKVVGEISKDIDESLIIKE